MKEGGGDAREETVPFPPVSCPFCLKGLDMWLYKLIGFAVEISDGEGRWGGEFSGGLFCFVLFFWKGVLWL